MTYVITVPARGPERRRLGLDADGRGELLTWERYEHAERHAEWLRGQASMRGVRLPPGFYRVEPLV